MAIEEPSEKAVLARGRGGSRHPRPAIASQRPAAVQLGGAAAGVWPSWAYEQLQHAIALAADAPDSTSIARLLYRNWFNPAVADAAALRRAMPFAGVFRSAHAGSVLRVRSGGVSVVERFDLIGPDGWWRTWGQNWRPPRSRPGSVRLMLTPYPERLADLVRLITGTLLHAEQCWALGCATDPRRLARYGCAVLDLESADAVPTGLLASLQPLLRPVTPPLCLPLAQGVGLAEYPDNGMTFGEHRCHLVALGLRHRADVDPLTSIAAVFNAHGLEPAVPYRARRTVSG